MLYWLVEVIRTHRITVGDNEYKARIWHDMDKPETEFWHLVGEIGLPNYDRFTQNIKNVHVDNFFALLFVSKQAWKG